MITKESIHKLTKEEFDILRSLIGKSICHIQSDTIHLIPSKPKLYTFSKWIEITLWHNSDAYNFNYEYDEAYSGDDFITLEITKSTRPELISQNASISFAGDDNFIVSKIKVYGYSYQVELDTDQIENISNESIIILEDKNQKQICIQCLYSYLDVNVTMDEDLILKAIKRSLDNHDNDMILKHTIE